ncbi:TrmH family RNA methyltransferase [Candidatus Saccharibacteria bacterium]|nr:TrmH family RNA methyltransferase [Candidatus Saccharibacteria bacterium]
MEVVLVLHNIRSCYNVGAILRTAEGLGVKRVYLSGYTPRVHDENLVPHLREKIDHEIHKTALGAEDLVKVISEDDIKTMIVKCRTDGWQIVGLENNIKGNICQLDDPNLKEKLGDRVILILGEEVGGIDPELHNLINEFLEIPMRGKKESFNVSVATGIALFGLLY